MAILIHYKKAASGKIHYNSAHSMQADAAFINGKRK